MNADPTANASPPPPSNLINDDDQDDYDNCQEHPEANSTQNYFLIAPMLSFFCDSSDKSAVFNILRQNETIFDIGNG